MNLSTDQLNRLVAAFPNLTKLAEPMSLHTSFRIGGPADALVLPTTVPELQQVLQFCYQHQLPTLVIGNGSNLLVRDRGIRAIVIKVAGAISTVTLTPSGITAEAGISLASLARTAAEASLGGLEFAAGIPGSLGGAVMMNAGAYGGEMKDVVERVLALDQAGAEHMLAKEQLDFSYRHSALQDQQLIAARVELCLQPRPAAESQAMIADLAARRREKQPLHLPSAGSVFKRPPGHFTGALIQQAGLMGKRIGGAEVSTLHAGFIVNVGNASAADVEDLIHHVQATVLQQFGVSLETEIRIVGE